MQIRPSQISSRAVGFTSSGGLVLIFLGGAAILGLLLLGLGGALMVGCSSSAIKAVAVGGTGGIEARGGGTPSGGMGGPGGMTVQVFEKANGWPAYHPAGSAAETTGGRARTLRTPTPWPSEGSSFWPSIPTPFSA